MKADHEAASPRTIQAFAFCASNYPDARDAVVYMERKMGELECELNAAQAQIAALEAKLDAADAEMQKVLVASANVLKAERIKCASAESSASYFANKYEAERKAREEFEQNHIGICAAWKRDYEGQKERGDAWMQDCKAAESALAKCFEKTRGRCAKICLDFYDMAAPKDAWDCYEAIRAMQKDPLAPANQWPDKAQEGSGS